MTSRSASPRVPRITISICTYDRYDVLPKAIESAVAQSLPKGDYRIVVVDNSPDHEKAAHFGRRYESVENLTYLVEKTPGLSNARNVSARECGTEFLAFMDDDAIASPRWLEEILRAFDSFDGKAMVVGGQVRPLWGAPRPPWLHDGLLGNVSVVDWGGALRIAKPSEWFAGTNISFRTSAILEHGGFATNLGRTGSGASLLSNEEVHLLERVREAGGTSVYAPDAYVDHLVEPGRLQRSWFRRRAAWQAVSDYTMEPKRHASESGKSWKDVLRYFGSLPPHERTIRGLILDTDDPEVFRWQTGAIYLLTLMILSGFSGVSRDD